MTTAFSKSLLDHPGGGETLYLDLEEAETYNADPDLYAAAHFGFLSAEQYREWINTDGAALCGERTTSGRMCKRTVSRFQLTPNEWMDRHRRVACSMHSKGMP